MIEQILIACTGAVAIWLSQDARESWRKYACLFGMAGQPFWFYSAWQGEQWGIFILSFFYAWAWLKGVRTHWLKHKSFYFYITRFGGFFIGRS